MAGRRELRPFVFCALSPPHAKKMLYFKFGQDRLAETNALKGFELGQGVIRSSARGFLVAQQVIEPRCERNVLPKVCHWPGQTRAGQPV